MIGPRFARAEKPFLHCTRPWHSYQALFSFCSLPGSASGKEPACQCRRCKGHRSVPGSGRSLEEGMAPTQCSYLVSPVDRGGWWAVVHGVTQSRTQLKRLSMHGWAWKTLFLAKFRSFLLQRPFGLRLLHIPSSFESAQNLLTRNTQIRAELPHLHVGRTHGTVIK